MKTIFTAGIEYDRTTSLDLRDSVIAIRDEALDRNAFNTAVELSHVIAWMAVAITELMPEE